MSRSSYDGFRATIKAVGTGPRGSRSLTFEEARAAMAAILAGDVSDAQAGAFLIAMRVKGETPEELAGLARALRDAAVPMRGVALERDRPPGPHDVRALDAPHRDRALGVEQREGAADALAVLELPERLGDRLPDAAGARASAALTRAVANGEDGVIAYAVALSAGLRLAVSGLARDAVAGMAAARAAVADGRAGHTLAALLG